MGCSEASLLLSMTGARTREIDGYSRRDKDDGADWFQQLCKIAVERNFPHLVEESKHQAQRGVDAKRATLANARGAAAAKGATPC